VGLESVEGTGGGYSVGTHVLEIEPISNLEFWEIDIFSDAVHRVACWSKNGALVLCGLVLGSRGKHQSFGVVVVEHHTVEGLVDSIITVVQKVLLTSRIVVHCSLSEDIDGQSVRGGDEISSRFGNDFYFLREEVVQNWSNSVGNDSKVNLLGVVSWPSSTKIQDRKIESNFFSLLENSVSASDGRDKRIRAHASTSDVERNSYNVEVEFLGEDQEVSGNVQWGSEFGAESADGFGVIGDNSEEQAGSREDFGDLREFVSVIESHHLDVAGLGKFEMRDHFAGIGVDNPIWMNSTSQDLLDFSLRSAVEIGSQRIQ